MLEYKDPFVVRIAYHEIKVRSKELYKEFIDFYGIDYEDVDMLLVNIRWLRMYRARNRYKRYYRDHVLMYCDPYLIKFNGITHYLNIDLRGPFLISELQRYVKIYNNAEYDGLAFDNDTLLQDTCRNSFKSLNEKKLRMIVNGRWHPLRTKYCNHSGQCIHLF